ncbi:hypothetical protein Lser_V15G25567 [Lactuca serriola]
MARMGYEGVFPPTIKKLLPPYWRFLVHIFISCISGRRAGADEVSLHNTGAIVALAAGLDFNFSRFILDDMVGNIVGKGRDKFLMFPRFLQMIFNKKYLEIEKGGDTIDLKSLGSSTFGLMKQNRKGKFMFKGKHPLVKFGKFAEVSGSSATESSSTYEEYEDDVITASEKEEERVPSVAIVAEEHDQLTNVEVQSDYDDGEKDDDEKDEFEESTMQNAVVNDDEEDEDDLYHDIDLSGFDKDDIPLDFESNECFLTNVELNTFFDNINDVACDNHQFPVKSNSNKVNMSNRSTHLTIVY